jgi:hypothetical protein
MTCYFRHLGAVFTEAGITVTQENRKKVDQIIHGIVGTTYKDCPGTWREVKKRLALDKSGFVSELIAAWIKAQAKDAEK